MTRYSVALLAFLASTAMARPQGHGHSYVHKHNHKATGSGALVQPTDGPFGMANSTTSTGPTGAAPGLLLSSVSTSVVAVPQTVTVIPLPASSGGAAVTSSLAAQSQAAVSGASAASLGGAEANVCATSPTTSTVTSTDYTTVTVSPSAASANAASSNAAPYQLSNTTTPLTAPTAIAASASKKSSSAALAVSAASATASSLASPSASSSASVAPGGFYAPSSVSSYAPSSVSTSALSSAQGYSAGGSATAASSSASATSTSGTTSSGNGSKKGVAFNDASLSQALAGKASHAYNWASSPGGTIASGMTYMPMLWGEKAVDTWASDAAAAIASGSTHALGFNEPDLSSQSNMLPTDAAALYIKYMNPLSGQIKLGAPAVTNGAGTSPLMGQDWLQAFFDACDGQCKVDFCPYHWYDSATNAAYFTSHQEDILSTCQKGGGSQVMVTEFAATGSLEQQQDFLNTVMPYMDAKEEVAAYFYFMTADGILLDGTELSALGQAFVG